MVSLINRIISTVVCTIFWIHPFSKKKKVKILLGRKNSEPKKERTFFSVKISSAPLELLRIPIVLKKKEEEPTDSGRRKSAFTKHEDPAENADDGVMILPLAKFKLDEKFNLLTRTAEMMNHEFL